MSNDDKKEYFASKEGDDTADILLGKAYKWFNNLDSHGYLDKIRELWAAYHGAYYNDIDNGHRITFGGEQGELSMLGVNHLRNITRHILVMITATRPAMEARAINTDYESLMQAKLANQLLDYYLREKRLEKYLKNAVEYALVMGAGYVKMEWNATSGEIYDRIDPEYDEETGELVEEGYPVYEGDVEFQNLSPFDVVVDPTKESQDHDWILTRSFKNRFDVAAKYPELEDRILSVPVKDAADKFRFSSMGFNETDDIPLYEFFHKRTESMPEGRYLLFLDRDLVLMDAPMPYDELPVYRISASDILGTPYGYTPIFDLMPLQDSINSLYSTILSNQSTFGVQNILLPRGTDVVPNNLIGGLNLIEYNAQMGKPEALNLTNTPEEIFKFLDMLVRDMETISGVNSVSRGNPESNLKSGTSLALVQSMALQYMSGLQQSYVQMMEDVGTGLINMLQKFASVPRVAMIVGKTNRTEMREFTGDDIKDINRVIIDVGNPLANTTAGKVEMADHLLQMGVIKTPEQYITVMNTGQLDTLTEDTMSELMLIKSENEELIKGNSLQAVATEQHSLHIKEHKAVLADPDLKKNSELVRRTLDHIQQHIDLLRTTDPDLLMLMGEQPLGPVGGSPANQPAPGQQFNESALDPNMPIPPVEELQQQTSGVGLPQPATPPAPFDQLPTDPTKM